MVEKSYDLLVLGSGPAGEKGAAQAAYFGKKVALIEKEDVLGGAAANTGTLPSKTLRESALYLSGFRQRDLYGMSFQLNESVRARDFLYRERLVVQSERSRISDNLNLHEVDLYRGFGTFVDHHTILVTPKNDIPIKLHADVILIATGSHPFQPPMFPFYDSRVYDSDTILHINDIPESMLIAGGGVIGCEYACMFAALGIKIHLVEGRDQLLSFLDLELSEGLTKCLRGMNIDLHLSTEIEKIQAGENITIKVKKIINFCIYNFSFY